MAARSSAENSRRISFAKISEPLALPQLLSLQTDSFDWLVGNDAWTAEVADSGVIRSGEDRVDVLLFVNRPTTNKQTRQPQVYKDQVTARMERVGNDWLVDCLLTSTSNDCG